MEPPIPNTEIEDALKEFAQKSAVEHEIIKVNTSRISSPNDTPKILKIMMRFSGGYLRDERQAAYSLYIIIVLIFGLSFYIFLHGGTSNNSKAPKVLKGPDVIAN